MSKIIIIPTDVTPGWNFMSGLKGIVGAGYSNLQEALKKGTPIFEHELFLNNHEEVANKLRGIILLGERCSVGLKYFELQPGEESENCSLAACEIGAEILENILSGWETRKE